MKRMLPLAAITMLAACSQEAPTKDAKPVAEKAVTDDATDELEAEQKSIEEAADAAAKLVEQETNEELEAIRADTATGQ